jgi:hypothetical protein
MQRFKVTYPHGFHMIDTRDGMAGAFMALARSEFAQPGRLNGPVTIEYVASADSRGRFAAD